MAHNHNKIILNLMIKNESKIIERCIGRALEHADAVSILDTGSTDNTVEICQKYLKNCGKPFKISVEPFKNFGYNRTISFQKTQELCKELNWDPKITYAMTVDADMVIKPAPEFKDFKMTVPGYKLIQQNGALKYFNNRFMQCAFNWKCVGVTHEYWSGDPVHPIPYEIFYIDDIGDGGSKSDKFERDNSINLEDLKTDPNNGRTHFYLAQSYKDFGKFVPGE
jgi:glycosyltransferase involved in cell wall biosynthesis